MAWWFHGAPQGSVLGPQLLTVYMLLDNLFTNIFQKILLAYIDIYTVLSVNEYTPFEK